MPSSLLEAVPKIWWQNLGLFPTPYVCVLYSYKELN